MKYKYTGQSCQMCDAWYLNVEERIHVFNLRLPEGYSVGHAYTDDLLSFNICDDILPVLPEKDFPEDCLSKYTGCAITGKDGLHYIYYTMRNSEGRQQIGLATSKDLKNFALHENNPVLFPDEAVFGIKNNMDCRDMIVVYDNEKDIYYGYFATMALINGNMTGAVGMAYSYDLVKWENQKIVYAPKSCGVIEVPDVFFMDGKWYLTFLTHASFGMRGVIGDSHVTTATLYAVSDTPDGTFEDVTDNVLIGGGAESGYTCRTFIYKGDRCLLYIDKSKNDWAVSYPKKISIVNGDLCACYHPLLENLRAEHKSSCPDSGMFELQSTSVAWKTGTGEIYSEDNCMLMSTDNYTYQHAILKNCRCSSLEIVADIEPLCKECGFSIDVYNKDGNLADKKFIAADAEEKTLSFYEGGLSFICKQRRKYNFVPGERFNLRIIASEGQLEAYVNDLLIIQTAMETGAFMTPGILCGKGKVKAYNFNCYELKN